MSLPRFYLLLSDLFVALTKLFNGTAFFFMILARDCNRKAQQCLLDRDAARLL